MVHYSQAATKRFEALGDSTRIAIIERLAAEPTSVSALARDGAMTVTGMAKHIRILEAAGLVTTRKEGRVRTCELRLEGLDEMTQWIARYRQMAEERLDRLEEFLGGMEEHG